MATDNVVQLQEHPSGPVHDAVHEWFKHHEDDYLLDADAADQLAAYIIERCGQHPLPPGHVMDQVREMITRRRAVALAALLSGEHVDQVSREVFSYVDADQERTPDQIAEGILRYIAHQVIAPLMLRGSL
ncbi:MAG: hypothetical protein KDB37_12870 [Ilumatobacter sp.]|nr:hypothetical protein [Ilumatobacter sp.]